MPFDKTDKRKTYIVMLRCSVCGSVISKTEKMFQWDIKRRWSELVSQKDVMNASTFNLCCDDQPLEYYIGNELAREVIFK